MSLKEDSFYLLVCFQLIYSWHISSDIAILSAAFCLFVCLLDCLLILKKFYRVSRLLIFSRDFHYFILIIFLK